MKTTSGVARCSDYWLPNPSLYQAQRAALCLLLMEKERRKPQRIILSKAGHPRRFGIVKNAIAFLLGMGLAYLLLRSKTSRSNRSPF